MKIINKTNSRWIPRNGLVRTTVIRIPHYLVSKLVELALLMDIEYENGLDELCLVRIPKESKITLQKNFNLRLLS